ncbi:MAG TPA: energy transducer TonB, partial [Vicinamibacterales bacterium]|nr:energy transducer TonB [Vicinamibacterales bacterium]
MCSRVIGPAVIAAALLTTECADLQAVQLSSVKTPRKIKDLKPLYPSQSLTAGDEGVVVVELNVDASRSVMNARVIWSKCPGLNDAALKAVRGWQFEKTVVNSAATAFAVTTEVPFRLPVKLRSRAGRPVRADGLTLLRACQGIIDLLAGDRRRMNGVIPVAVKAMALQADGGHLRVGDGDAG